MAPADLALFAFLSALNLSLAVLVTTARGWREVNRLLAALFALNGFSAIAAVAATLDGFSSDRWGSLALALNFASLVPLGLLLLWVPTARGTPRTRTAISVAWTAFVLPLVLAPLMFLFGPAQFKAAAQLNAVVGGLAVHGTTIVGLLLFLDAYLSSPSPVQRERARFFLAAFAAKAGAAVSIVTFAGPLDAVISTPTAGFDTQRVASIDAAAAVTGIILSMLLRVLLLAVPLALLARRLRGRGARPIREEGLIVAALATGFVLPIVEHGAQLEYLLLRPLLLAYGILHLQLLDVDVRRTGAVVGTAVLSVMGALVVLATTVGEEAGASTAVAVAIALVATLAVGSALGIPALRRSLIPDGASSSRRLLIYRAALEGALQEGREAHGSASLRALRAELGVSDREHGLLVATLEAEDARASLRPGHLFLGRYRLVAEIGRGAAGEVWRARDERLGREVAIKRLSGDLRRSAEALERFEREMRFAGALHHPNIAAVHDVEVVGDEAFLVMELVPGGTLSDRLRNGPLDEAEAVRMARDVLAALEAVHAKGIVHLDVKPSNILLDETGRAKLTDFTIAREVISGETIGVSRGAPVGTPAFMAPEQARGLSGTVKSDIYAVGATLYAALAGLPPIAVDGFSEHEALRRVIGERPPLPLRHVSAATNEALLRALAKDPERRFESAAEMAEALGATPHGTPSGSAPRR